MTVCSSPRPSCSTSSTWESGSSRPPNRDRVFLAPFAIAPTRPRSSRVQVEDPIRLREAKRAEDDGLGGTGARDADQSREDIRRGHPAPPPAVERIGKSRHVCTGPCNDRKRLSATGRRAASARSDAAGQPGAPVACRTASRIASAATSAVSTATTAGSASTVFVAAQNIVSPSKGVQTGAIARAIPAFAARAHSHASVFVSVASVTTQTSVVASRPDGRLPGLLSKHVGRPHVAFISPDSGDDGAVASSTSPTALTTATAATTPPLGRPTLATPSPPFVQRPGRASRRCIRSPPRHCRARESPSRPRTRRIPPPQSASRRAAQSEVIDDCACHDRHRPGGHRMSAPPSASQRTTPSAAARPNALPPVRRIAFAPAPALAGERASVSRVPGAPPRTSQDATLPSGSRTAVQPVQASWSVQ